MAEELDFLSMADDDLPDYVPETPREEGGEFAGKTEAQIQAELEARAGSAEDEDTEDDGFPPEDRKPAGGEEEDDDDEPEDEPGDKPDGEQEEEEEEDQPEDTPADEPAPKDKKPAAKKEEKKPIPAPTSDSFMAKVTAPFKANGREIRVETADEAVQLMQMGANYNQKMAKLKPNLQLMRQLEDAGLLNATDVARAIDLLKHNKPEAIAQLAKKSGVDPLDVSDEAVANYKPAAVEFDPAKQALDDQFDAIEHSEHRAKVMSEIRRYDDETKQLLFQHPHVIGLFHKQMTNGIYDRIAGEIERRQLTGKLPSNTPFLHAYKQVGDELEAQGAFADLDQAAANAPEQQTPTEPVRRKVKPRSAQEQAAVNDRKKAASTTRSAPVKQNLLDIDPMNMSDEEFEKHSQQVRALMR